METDVRKIEVILKEDRQFLVPIYQRRYQWNEKNLLPFWEDVVAKATEFLDFNDSRFEHYMGALIISPVNLVGTGIGQTPKLQVVDGQQRLTSFQIFLAALREVARYHQFENFIKVVDGYLFNTPRAMDKDTLTKFKVIPTKSDREIFFDIVELTYEKNKEKYSHFYYKNGKIKKGASVPAYFAYYLFFSKINEFISEGLKDFRDIGYGYDYEEVDNDDSKDKNLKIVENCLNALFKSILDQLKLVTILLDENDDAQVVFETLNSKGEPLLPIDLIKNNIFHRTNPQRTSTSDLEEIYEKFWRPLDANWWREFAPNTRPKRRRIDHFLANMLAAETGNNITIRELYAEYRDFTVPNGEPRFNDVEEELKNIKKFIPIYENLERRGGENQDETIFWLGEKLARWQIITAYPVIFQIGISDLDENERKKLAELIYSYLVRRELCNLTTKNLNKVFLSIVKHFKDCGTSIDSFQSFFKTKLGDSSRFPSDDELKSSIQTTDVYRNIVPRTRLNDILVEIEIAIRSEKLTEKINYLTDTTIEHVLPQLWDEEWPFEDGTVMPFDFFKLRFVHDPKRESREKIIHTLGNLTLVSKELNSSVGNTNFENKKKKYFENSSLFLNKWFIDKDRWTEAEIRERNDYLSEKVAEIWQGLET